MDFLVSGEDYLAKFPDFKLVGREEELKRLSGILMREKANSVLLVGSGGVGCTALCMGMQAIKADQNTPFDIVSKRLFWLDTDRLFSSGDEKEINSMYQKGIDVLYRTPDSILIIEDMKDFIEATRNHGATHFLNALTLAVKNNKTQVILECRDEDLSMVLKSNSDILEYYTIMYLDEPPKDALKNIVTYAANKLTKHHGIKISYDAIDTSIELTTKYRTKDLGLSRAQPERAITLIDRALSSYRLLAHQGPPKGMEDTWEQKQKEIKNLYEVQRTGEIGIIDLENQLEDQRRIEKERISEGHEPTKSYIKTFMDSGGLDSTEVKTLKLGIAALQKELIKHREKFNALTEEINSKLELDRNLVIREFSIISGIDAGKLNENEREKLLRLEKSLNEKIYGQTDVVKKVANAIKVAKVGKRDNNTPQAAFMFLGPSGVGKTELAKVLAASLLGDVNALTRFDMAEYMEKHAVAKLIGAPPGYEGFENGGILTNLMHKNPYRILLFDEIEKAHPDVFNIFLSILSAARLTDNMGRECNFSETIIIMTTNIGQTHFLDNTISPDEQKKRAIEELGKIYRSELLNRFAGRENIYCFDTLTIDAMVKIVWREIQSFDAAYAPQGIKVDITNDTIEMFCRDHYDPTIGARGLPGYIKANLEPEVVNLILSYPDIKGTLVITYDGVNKLFKTRVEKDAS
jgi:ATP-dependent Clp protease ATP-binding subunit ClpB